MNKIEILGMIAFGALLGAGATTILFAKDINTLLGYCLK
jgi:hypothetical protein